MLILSYPLERIDFRPWAESILSVERLEDLHLRPDPVPFANYVERLEHYANLLRNDFDSVRAQYLELVNLVAPLLGGVELRQAVPSMRCHLAGAGTVSAFHRDGDPKYRITPGLINGWVPLTTVGGANSLYVESSPGSGDHRPLELTPGQIVIFDAFHLEHGSYPNRTESTRVSFDFRFMPNAPDQVRELGILATDGVIEQRVDSQA
jgi:hypothetical protein